MNVLEAIHSRRSVKKYTDEPVAREQIEQLLDAGAQAPNYFRVQPWRFVVLQGSARARLGEILAASMLKRAPDSTPAAVENERTKLLKAPVIIAVGVDKSIHPKLLEVDNVAAAAAAIQNVLLAAVELGLGAIWRSGTVVTNPDAKAFLGLEADQTLLGIIFVGHAAEAGEQYVRPSFQERTVWMDD